MRTRSSERLDIVSFEVKFIQLLWSGFTSELVSMRTAFILTAALAAI
jgi:hypothetical protein